MSLIFRASSWRIHSLLSFLTMSVLSFMVMPCGSRNCLKRQNLDPFHNLKIEVKNDRSLPTEATSEARQCKSIHKNLLQ